MQPQPLSQETRPSIQAGIRLHRRRAWPWVALALLGVLALTGCGGGGESSDANPPAGPAIGRIEVGPAAVLLTTEKRSHDLKARAFDPNGREVSAPVTWHSSRPTEVSVAADGRVTSVVPFGSAQIHAEVQGVRSASVLVTAAEVPAGVQLLRDAQVVVLPRAVNDTDTGLDVEVESVLSGLATPPAVGSLLLGSEGIPIGGEVTSASAEPGGLTRVRFRLPQDLRRLMPRARVRESIDLRGLPLTPPGEVLALYDMNKVGDEWVFTPKPGLTVGQAVPLGLGKSGGSVNSSPVGPVRPLTKFRLGPFECEIALPQLPVSMTNPGGFSIKFEPIYTVDVDENAGLRRLEIGASFSAKMKAALQFNAGGLTNFTCDATLAKRLAPVPGWVGLILSGEFKTGLGFEAEGSITIPVIGVESQVELTATVSAGIDCTSGDCQSFGRFVPDAKSGWRFVSPQDALGNSRSELFIFGYGFIGLKAGATLVEQMRIEVLTIRGGLKAETNLAPESAQMLAPVLPGFSDYRSEYKLSALHEIVAGSVNKGKTDLQTLLQRLGFFKATLLKWQLSVPLGGSPKGSVSVSKLGVRNGDIVNFAVNMDPATAYLNLPIVGTNDTRVYNVKRVRIVRTGPNENTRTVATVEAAPDQMDFNFTWVAEGVVDEEAGQFSAFVDTSIPLPFGLELGPALLSTQKALVNTAEGVKLGEVGSADNGTVVPREVIGTSTTNTAYFSPEGRRILYSKELLIDPRTLAHNLFLYSATDGRITPLTNDAHEKRFATWLPSGDTIIYAAISPSINTNVTVEVRDRQVNTGAERVLFGFDSPGGGKGAVLGLSASPDGRHVAMVAPVPPQERSNPRLIERNLFVFRTDGTGLRLLLTSEIRDRPELNWSPDGRQLLLVDHIRLADETRMTRIVRVDVESGQSVRYQPNDPMQADSSPMFSPDGSTIAFLRRTNFSTALALMRVDGSGFRVIHNAHSETLLGWHHEGNAVIANASLGAGSPTRMIKVSVDARVAPVPLATFGGFVVQSTQSNQTNLDIRLEGATQRALGEIFTVALNARNLSPTVATDVRMELEVPPGWVVLGNTGARGCTQTFSSVVCKLDQLENGSPQAVLVEVQAPEFIGEHELRARITSSQRDSELVNNEAKLNVDIGPQRR